MVNDLIDDKSQIKGCWNVRAFEVANQAIRDAESAMDAIVKKKCPLNAQVTWWHGNSIQRGVILSSGGYRGVRVQNHKTGVLRWVPPYFIISINGRS